MSQLIPCRRITMATLKDVFEDHGIHCDRDPKNPKNGLCLHLPPCTAGKKKPGVATTPAAVRLKYADLIRDIPRHEHIFLERDSRGKTLVFWATFPFALNSSATLDVRKNSDTLLTTGTDFAKFSLLAPDTLLAKYGIPYAMGLYPEQIVDAAECFADTVEDRLE